jgi:hypothetical protein
VTAGTTDTAAHLEPDRVTSPGFGSTLAAEWRKFWALPVSRTVLLSTVGVTVGVSVLVVLFGGGSNLAEVQRQGKYDAIFFGAVLGVWAFIFLGANFVACEFRAGMADYTFVATPRRSRVIISKILIISGLGLVVGLLISLVDVALTQGALAVTGYPTLRLDDPALVRPILLYIGVGMSLQGILGCMLAVLVRNAFGAMVLTILLTLIPIMFAQFFGATYTSIVPRWTPGALVESLSGVAGPHSDANLPLPLALLGAAVWVGVIGCAAITRVVRSDAR